MSPPTLNDLIVQILAMAYAQDIKPKQLQDIVAKLSVSLESERVAARADKKEVGELREAVARLLGNTRAAVPQAAEIQKLKSANSNLTTTNTRQKKQLASLQSGPLAQEVQKLKSLNGMLHGDKRRLQEQLDHIMHTRIIPAPWDVQDHQLQDSRLNEDAKRLKARLGQGTMKAEEPLPRSNAAVPALPFDASSSYTKETGSQAGTSFYPVDEQKEYFSRHTVSLQNQFSDAANFDAQNSRRIMPAERFTSQSFGPLTPIRQADFQARKTSLLSEKNALQWPSFSVSSTPATIQKYHAPLDNTFSTVKKRPAQSELAPTSEKRIKKEEDSDSFWNTQCNVCEPNCQMCLHTPCQRGLFCHSLGHADRHMHPERLANLAAGPSEKAVMLAGQNPRDAPAKSPMLPNQTNGNAAETAALPNRADDNVMGTTTTPKYTKTHAGTEITTVRDESRQELVIEVPAISTPDGNDAGAEHIATPSQKMSDALNEISAPATQDKNDSAAVVETVPTQCENETATEITTPHDKAKKNATSKGTTLLDQVSEAATAEITKLRSEVEGGTMAEVTAPSEQSGNDPPGDIIAYFDHFKDNAPSEAIFASDQGKSEAMREDSGIVTASEKIKMQPAPEVTIIPDQVQNDALREVSEISSLGEQSKNEALTKTAAADITPNAMQEGNRDANGLASTTQADKLCVRDGQT